MPFVKGYRLRAGLVTLLRAEVLILAFLRGKQLQARQKQVQGGSWELSRFGLRCPNVSSYYAGSVALMRPLLLSWIAQQALSASTLECPSVRFLGNYWTHSPVLCSGGVLQSNIAAFEHCFRTSAFWQSGSQCGSLSLCDETSLS